VIFEEFEEFDEFEVDEAALLWSQGGGEVI
jgi:hypothetical protein